MSQKRVLLAVDVNSDRRLMKMLLEKEGFDVVVVPDDMLAMKASYAAAFDLIITDLNMPLSDGYEVCESIRLSDLNRHTPILLITNKQDEGAKARALEVGASGLLTKPLQTEQIIQSVRLAFRARR